MMKEFYLNDDGIALHCKLDKPEDTDRCPLLLMFHGLTGHMEEDHIAGLCEAVNKLGIATLRAELYGHGKSGGAFEDHTLLKWINNALTVIEYAQSLDFVTEYYVSGHSQGGLLTILLSGLKNDLFKAVIPLSPALVITEGARKGSLLGLPFDPEHIPEKIVMGDRVLKGNYFATAQLLHPEEMMERYHGPVLIVHGDEDEAVPFSCSIDAIKHYEHGKLVAVAHADHCFTGHLEELFQAVTDFLKELD
ncbi:MAG: alpha/beta hydrolase [Erysipelotrichaceae bacterium]|nr:alpha/beta hydrolase [Erysipelotrichaceae bacterium]